MFKTSKFILLLILGFSLASCSKMGVTSSSKIVPISETKGSSLIEFDQKLSKIQDTASAETAIDHFSNYVQANTVARSFSSTKAASIKAFSIQDKALQTRFARFASIEAKARHAIASSSGIKAMEVSGEMISVKKMTDIINSMSINDDSPQVTMEQVQNTQAVVRANIPHLASSESSSMTPLEASVLTYYMLTGDTGSDDSASVPLQADQ